MAHSFDIWYVAMANGPLHKFCHSCPWGQIWPCPGGSIVSIDLLWEKNSKIFFSETTWPTALIFGMWQWLMVLYINCASHAPGVKGLGSIRRDFGLIFKMADVTRFDSSRFVNYKNGVFNSLHGWLPWQRAYFEDYRFEAIRQVSLRC